MHWLPAVSVMRATAEHTAFFNDGEGGFIALLLLQLEAALDNPPPGEST